MAHSSEKIAQADQTVYDRIVVPAFFAKLAEHGIRPRNADEAARYLKLGDGLEALRQEAMAKDAAAGDNFLDAAIADVNYLLERGPASKQASQSVQRAAEILGKDPQISAAVTTLLESAAHAAG